MSRKLSDETFTPSKKQKLYSDTTILFHGNCSDGWISAYIAHSHLKNKGIVHMYPISPSQIDTWPALQQMSGTNVLLLDVSVSKEHRDSWMMEGVLSIQCIDHHVTSIEHWPTNSPIRTERCASFQTWEHFHPGQEIPHWIYSIDRFDRWDNPTYEDRCLREVLNIIARKPVEKKLDEAFNMTNQFMMNIGNPIGLSAILEHGRNILKKKDHDLINILHYKGSIHTFTQEYINGWNLPQNWLNLHVFIIDNTGISFDSTEAAYLVFQKHPNISVFINYRIRYDTVLNKTIYTYSARSQSFNVTDGTLLKGHPTSAGATLTKGDTILPFLLACP